MLPISNASSTVSACSVRGPLDEDADRERERERDGSVPVRNYDVFLNHRGPDVKKTLVSHLCAAFHKVNVYSFVDNREIQPGDLSWATIKSAIHHSKAHIAVFSPCYAESEWCLEELRHLMECFHNKSSDLFLPVFYNLAPSDLRSQTKSCFNSALEKHCSKYEAIVIDNWKKDLHAASMVSGYVFPDAFQGDEGRLVESIVSKVIQVLSRATLLHGPDHPVGVDEKLREALDLMERGKSRRGVQKLGIYGMGGLGKTTLAKSIYNRIHREFESACFMQSVSEGSKDANKGLKGLQKDMLHELLNTKEIDVPNTARGKQIIRDRLEGKKVLIILDDVSEKEQLDELMPPHDCHLGEDSKIVITSRDEEILDLARVQTYLEMGKLSRPLACELFNLHAFHLPEELSRDRKKLQEEPSGDLKKLAQKVADACQGLPLALEVLGSHLRGKDISEWEATVEVLKARINLLDQQRQVTAKLRISFDALRSAAEKTMFLDIACFLFQVPKDKGMRIWRSEYGDAAADLHLKSLIRKCLVKLNKNGELTMHNLLRDMGREIVDDSHIYYRKRSHLWREDDVCDVLETRNGTSHVRGLSSNVEKEWETMSFAGMKELKLLVLSNVTLTGDFSMIPRKLIWLQLHYCPTPLPLNEIRLDKVAVLDLEGSNLTSFNCADCKFKNLKELNLRNCSNVKEFPVEFCKSFNSLEILILSGCVNLERMPDSVSDLSSSLRYLDISGCSKLTTLPSDFTNLRALNTWLMNNCGGLTNLPDAIGQLTALEKIGLDRVPLSTLPQSFGSLRNLVSLRLDHSWKLREIPSTIGNLTNLTSLDIISCPLVSEIPLEVTKLQKLRHFQVSNCESVSQLAESIENLWELVELHLHDNVKLSSLPLTISKLWNLQILNLQGCTNLWEVENLPDLLTSLDVGGCTSLKYLGMRSCSNVKTLQVSSLTNLRRLDLHDCTQLVELNGLECLGLLSHLDISGCRNFLHLPSGQLEKLTSLKELYLSGSGVSIVQDNRSPWMQKVGSLEAVSMMGDEVPDCFEEFQGVHLLEIEPRSMGYSMKMVVPEGDVACRGVLCCFVSARQGRYTSVWAKVVGQGDEGIKFNEKLFNFDHSDCKRLMHMGIFRVSHPFVASLKGGDEICVEIISLKPIQWSAAVVKLMYGENEMEETLQKLKFINQMDESPGINKSQYLRLPKRNRDEPHKPQKDNKRAARQKLFSKVLNLKANLESSPYYI